ncbi:hypothetical protein NCCP28_06370 [Niallia sp. NCCP-28]|nr:hypothetical protein NCCP28_06370 [Niallia sp. NCCP-28]
MNNFQKAEMLLQFAGEMLMKNRLHIATWATKQSHKYYLMQVKGGVK